MRSVFSRQRLIRVFSFMLILSGLVFAGHIHEVADEEVYCERCVHAGSDAALYVLADYLSLTEPQKTPCLSSGFSICIELLHKHPRGPPPRV